MQTLEYQNEAAIAAAAAAAAEEWKPAPISHGPNTLRLLFLFSCHRHQRDFDAWQFKSLAVAGQNETAALLLVFPSISFISLGSGFRCKPTIESLNDSYLFTFWKSKML